jgi:hypothetical protein
MARAIKTTVDKFRFDKFRRMFIGQRVKWEKMKIIDFAFSSLLKLIGQENLTYNRIFKSSMEKKCKFILMGLTPVRYVQEDLWITHSLYKIVLPF